MREPAVEPTSAGHAGQRRVPGGRALQLASAGAWRSATVAPADVAIAVLFVALFWPAVTSMAAEWWRNPDSNLGLILGPLAVVLAVNTGLHPARAAQPVMGTILLALFVALRLASELTLDAYSLGLSMLGSTAALTVFFHGWRQTLRWWLPLTLFLLAIPLPTPVWTAIAAPLQLRAAEIATGLLAWRNLPAELVGNVIHMPGGQVLVNDGCSGFGSMLTMATLSLVAASVWLRHAVSWVALVLSMLLAAMLLNGVRVFITAFLVFLVDPSYGEGSAHDAVGWAVFGVNLVLFAVVVWLIIRVEGWVGRRGAAS